ncbi:MAG: hypothetical protein HY922_02605 [Elusimicrobia bacterium]|nr:hypothetical protein [Elusimicrobiota bacterium]
MKWTFALSGRSRIVIKNIFAGSSSIVGRLFLAAAKRFGSVNEVYSSIEGLGGSLSLSAVSKVLKGLQDEFIIEKGPEGIALLQPEKLLQKLEEGYKPPKISSAVKLRLPGEGIEAVRVLETAMAGAARWVISGESSGLRYAVMADSSVIKVYATDCKPLLQYQNERFYNVLARQAEDSFLYFDAQAERGRVWASPIG